MTAFEKINSLDDIRRLIAATNDPDGESLHFELKGSKGSFDKDAKKNLAKEICAFANTYGGMICFHAGGGESLEAFEKSCTRQIHGKLHDWLRGSLEPPLLAIDMKQIDGVFVLNIPKSMTKPHRSGSDRLYYYRSGKSSSPMPEIMISSMYRSGDLLSCSHHLSANFYGDGHLVFDNYTKNRVGISGTKPKLTFIVYYNFGSFKGFNLSSSFKKYWSDDGNFVLHNDLDLRKFYSKSIVTNEYFRENILYPHDSIYSICAFDVVLPSDSGARSDGIGMLVQCVVNFVEAPKQEFWYSFRLGRVVEHIPSDKSYVAARQALLSTGLWD